MPGNPLPATLTKCAIHRRLTPRRSAKFLRRFGNLCRLRGPRRGGEFGTVCPMATKRTPATRPPSRDRTAVPRGTPTAAQRVEHVAVFPGSFDPATYGHLDVIARGRRLFDRVVVGVGRNPGKEPLFSIDERVEMLRELIAEMMLRDPDPRAAPVTVEAFDGLTVDFARRATAKNPFASAVLLRGIRNLSDLQSEVQQALTNRQVDGLETAFVVAGPDFAYTSSSLIRQITALGEPEQLTTMVPPSVLKRLSKKKRDRHPVLMQVVRTSGG